MAGGCIGPRPCRLGPKNGMMEAESILVGGHDPKGIERLLSSARMKPDRMLGWEY